MLRRTALAFGLAAALGLAPAAAQAHHAVNAQFDVTKLARLTGVLVRLDNINPHAYWTFDVKGADGKVQQWRLESVAPAGLRRAGVRLKEDIRPGQPYTFTFATARNGSNTGLLLGIMINGELKTFAAQ